MKVYITTKSHFYLVKPTWGRVFYLGEETDISLFLCQSQRKKEKSRQGVLQRAEGRDMEREEQKRMREWESGFENRRECFHMSMSRDERHTDYISLYLHSDVWISHGFWNLREGTGVRIENHSRIFAQNCINIIVGCVWDSDFYHYVIQSWPISNRHFIVFC